MRLTRYWFTFQGDIDSIGICRPGCGITAHNYEDAIAIIRKYVYAERDIPEIKSVQENVDISTLDQNHVLPNMGNCLV